MNDENTGLDGDRPRKRRRLSDPYTPTLQQLALEEIDLEIAIRQRIADTIQARLTWASLLRESLRTSTNGSGSFREAALDALDAIEEPCAFIYNRESHLAPPPVPPLANIPPSVVPPTDHLLSRTSSRSTRTRGLARPPPAPPKRLLFLRDTSTNPPEIAKLACSVCSRSDFSNLQGLLNHCRLRHQLEFGSHDECMQSCAVLVPEAERDFIVANGIELAGVSLPSLKRLFEIAVGAGENVKLPEILKSPAPQVKMEASDSPLPVPSEAVPSQSPPPEPTPPPATQSSSHVSRTLGYHVDTPALAPFLGRAPKQRQINVRADEDDPVDIQGSSGSSGLQARSMWRKPYNHRNAARKELDEVVPLSDLPATIDEKPDEGDGEGEEHAAKGERSRLQMLSGTRFHIAARVQVADYSLFIPPKRRPPDRPTHSHRWRLVVTSPSYSLPISSVLSNLTVASATDPPPSTLIQSIKVSEPPFVITSTTDRPFLARLTLTWAGSMNPPTEIEHWVELDPMRYSSAVLGEEQVFDVELDRSTELLPAREDLKAPSWDDEQVAGAVEDYAAAVPEEEEEPEPAYAVKLRSLLSKFPMTLKDVKGRFTARLPYTLVSTPAALCNMHYGRRKAIEMGRARALREAYNNVASQSSNADLRPLTTVDVFRWLEDEGLFLRPDGAHAAQSGMQSTSSRKRQSTSESDPRGKDFCRACGLQRAQHPTSEEQEVDIKPSMTTLVTPALGAALGFCTSFREDDDASTRPPILDVDALLSPHSGTDSDRRTPLPYGFSSAIITPRPRLPCSAEEDPSALRFHPEDLVAVADPRLTVAILRMTALPVAQQARQARRADPKADPHTDSHSARSPERDPVASSPSESLALSPRTLTTTSSLGLLDLQQPRADVLAHLGPSALLASTVKVVVRHLVARGVDAFRQDEAALRSVVSGRHRHRAGRDSSAPPQRLLAPGHVVRGLARQAQTDVAAAALLLCTARLGERGSSERRC
ncbi:hypothetical protein L226DRAFT_330040 [Lentinus tigrinus ALCF2SS1-7]|uniref:YEATS domain-containing protein n=1 Tax=Lentinus tigrinus ALCF2SS1-6 TaxID=1328759 RepID=A0A5C2SH57_9APHY|nr:hypothetical protein L227DRAFT_620848 [Lentinus tigrinus ALCF2SS1-6]RPD77707.1 hypothetical protein L226DRAFT_330040 [Lentinus tigrinus ALCF2SS1-7]